MSSSGKQLLVNLFVTFLFLYLVSPLGATFIGVVSADTYQTAMTMMAVSVGLWLLVHFRKKWQWHRTSFDILFLFWVLAIGLSIVSNMETLRRSMIGVWYITFYMGVWYVLHDGISNGGLSRRMLVDGLLNAGVLIVLFSVVQLVIQGFSTPPVSLIGNPNALGAVLLTMIPFAVIRTIKADGRARRILWAGYSLILMVNLLLTLSRGAWLGIFSALGLLLLLLVKHYDLLSWHAFKLWWKQRTILQQRMLGSLVLVSVVVSMIAGLLFINSFSIRERRPELRTRLWNSALTQFAEKPITGQGLYTFGRDYPLSISIPPEQSHAHAHSVPLNILAEMGLVGFAVFVMSVIWVLRSIVKRWSSVPDDERLLWIAGISALVGFSVHHLFDLPSMMPVVALAGLLMLVLVCVDDQPQPMTANWRKVSHPIGMMILWGGLIVSGLWSGSIYKQYLDAMRLSFAQIDLTEAERQDAYRETIALLDGVIAQDSQLPIYHQQQALVSGLLAETGDAEAMQQGIRTYQQFLQLEPNHAISWANLSALQWQSGDIDGAITSIQLAITLAPQYRFFQDLQSVYRGDIIRNDVVDVPSYYYNGNFSSFEFLRESLNMTFLPQVGWMNPRNN